MPGSQSRTTANQRSIDRSGIRRTDLRIALAVGGIILVALDLRPGLVSVGPLLPAIREYFRLSHTTAALLTSIPELLLGIMALPTPWLSRRFGRDPVILSALVLLTVSMVGRAIASNSTVLLVTTVGVGIGIAVAGALVGSFIKASFPNRAALMMGIYATALSLGSTLSAALTSPIMRLFDGNWRYGAGLWAGLGISAIAAWILVAGSTRSSTGATSAPHRLPWRCGTAWRIALYFGCQNFLFYSLISWTAPFFQEKGLTSVKAGLILASFTFVFMLANPVFGVLSRNRDRRRWLALCAALGAAGMAGMMLAPLSAPFAFFSVGAFGMGGAFTLGMTLPLDNTENADEATSWNAFVLMVGYVIAATGPVLVGALRDQDGNFDGATRLLFAVTLIMLALTPFLQPRPTRQ